MIKDILLRKSTKKKNINQRKIWETNKNYIYTQLMKNRKKKLNFNS